MAAVAGPRIGADRAAAILITLVLGLAACSSDSDSGSEAGTQVEAAETAPVEETSGSDDGSEAETETAESETAAPETQTAADVDCEPLFFNRGNYSTIAGGFTRSTTQAEAEEQQQRFTPTQMREIVDIYRPYQDVEGEVFGTLREGLDNLSADIDAFEAGTFAGPTGESYKTASIAPVLQAIGC